MSVYQSCKEAIFRARQLGATTTNRAADVQTRRFAAVKTLNHVHGPVDRDVDGALRARLVEVNAMERTFTADFQEFRRQLARQAPVRGPMTAQQVATNADLVSKTAALMQRFGFGNCGELSAVAFHYLRHQPLQGKVALFNWTGGNHMFVVAGLPATLTHGNWPYDPDRAPGAWGLSAVWCDAWTSNCFDAAKTAPWSMYSKQILQKAAGVMTNEARRATSLEIFALSDCRPGGG